MSLIQGVVRHYNFFGLEFDFDSVAFSIGDVAVYWYGIIIAVGFLLALVYGYTNAKRYNIDTDRMIDVVIFGLLGAIVGARAFSLIGDEIPLSSFSTFGEKVQYIIGIRNGGIGILGGIIGAFSVGGLTAKIRKVNVLDMFDLAGTGFLIGQAVGRWGNFINQEVYGNPTGSDWFGIGGTNMGNELVHPLFLYEMLWNIAVFFVLHKMSKKRAFKGQIFLSYIMSYTFARFWLESMRNTSFILMLGKMSMSQLFCVLMFAAAITVYVILYKRANVTVREKDYTEVFGEMCDDEEIAAAGYELLGCDEGCSDGELDSAYEALRDKYSAMLPEEEAEEDVEVLSKKEMRRRKKAEKEQAEREQSILEADAPEADEDGMIEISEEEIAIRAKAKLAEIEKAYKYVKGYRELTESERASFESLNEGEGNADEAD